MKYSNQFREHFHVSFFMFHDCVIPKLSKTALFIFDMLSTDKENKNHRLAYFQDRFILIKP